MKAKVNPFYRLVVISIDESVEVAEIFFDDTDEWNSFNINGKMYDIHFNYEPLESFKNRQDWLSSLVSVYMLWEDDETEYSRNLVTEVTLEL